MKNNIKNMFKKECKIKCEDKLFEYINYCINKNCNKIIHKTSKHHILPRKLFPEFANLNQHEWNCANLLHSDHYYAHYLLTEAIDDYKMLFAFCAMHNKDKSLKRISVDELIDPTIFQSKMEERSIKQKEYLSTINDILHINGDIIALNVTQRYVRSVCQVLHNKTKDNYLGKTVRSKITLNIQNKLNLIGYYVIKL